MSLDQINIQVCILKEMERYEIIIKNPHDLLNPETSNIGTLGNQHVQAILRTSGLGPTKKWCTICKNIKKSTSESQSVVAILLT